MPRTCRAPGCASETSSRYSPFCTTHRARLRRHGAVDQRGITKAELRPYLERVEARIKKNPDSPAWGHLEARWAAVREHAEGILASYRAGRPGSRYERLAAQEALKLGEGHEARELLVVSLAMFMMQELEPRQFRSDNGFRAELVRRVRHLSDMNVGSYFDRRSGKSKRVYRDLAPRSVAILGQWLAEAFGAAGLRLARLEERDAKEGDRQRQELRQALADLS